MTDWQTIVDQHGGLVWSTVCRLVVNRADAADCFQETFLEAVRVSQRESVRDWPALLRHLATVRALDLLRVRCRWSGRCDSAVDPAEMASTAAGPGEMAEAGELADRSRNALVELPPQQAEVFCLSCLDNLTYREIGNRLRIKTSAVGVLLHRARRRLHELLEPAGVRTASKR